MTWDPRQQGGQSGGGWNPQLISQLAQRFAARPPQNGGGAPEGGPPQQGGPQQPSNAAPPSPQGGQGPGHVQPGMWGGPPGGMRGQGGPGPGGQGPGMWPGARMMGPPPGAGVAGSGVPVPPPQNPAGGQGGGFRQALSGLMPQGSWQGGGGPQGPMDRMMDGGGPRPQMPQGGPPGGVGMGGGGIPQLSPDQLQALRRRGGY